MLSEFFSHGDENPHGWGAAVFDEGRAEIVKEAVSAAVSRNAKEFTENLQDTDLLVAHIRLATKGQVSPENTHPFVKEDKSGEEWVLSHNGTIFGSDALSGYVHRQAGETDSERILMYLVDSMNSRIGGDKQSLTVSEKISVIEKVLREITPDNKVNILLSDGKLLFAHTNYRGSMSVLNKDGFTLVSSRPLAAGLTEGAGECAVKWEELPLNTLMVYEKGSRIYRGIPHDNEYFEDEERTRALFLDYAYM